MLGTMRDSTNVSCIGLTESDTHILQNIFKIVQQLHKEIKFVDPKNLHEADLVFVNVNDADSLATLDILNEQITPIVISNTPLKNQISIKRPLVLKRVLQVVENICSTRNDSKQDNTNTSNHPHISNQLEQVLVVDDSFPVRKYMEQKLHELSAGNIRLAFAGNGEQAVTQIRTTAFDAVFLDVVMPDINGYKICKWIKSVQPNCKVILLTGRKSPIDKVRGSMSGCDAYLTKPPDEERLSEIYQEFIVSQSAARATA